MKIMTRNNPRKGRHIMATYPITGAKKTADKLRADSMSLLASTLTALKAAIDDATDSEDLEERIVTVIQAQGA